MYQSVGLWPEFREQRPFSKKRLVAQETTGHKRVQPFTLHWQLLTRQSRCLLGHANAWVSRATAKPPASWARPAEQPAPCQAQNGRSGGVGCTLCWASRPTAVGGASDGAGVGQYAALLNIINPVLDLL
jgi:hypothetical protein